MSFSPTSPQRSDFLGYLLGLLVLCLSSLASGALGALLTVRAIWHALAPDHAPTLGRLLRLLFTSGLGLRP